MNTPDFPGAGVPDDVPENALAQEIARIANELFSSSSHPSPVAPPHLGPSAAGPGAFGVSPAFAFPLVPGPMQKPPIPTAPSPKEGDLRTIPALVTDAVGGPAPVELARTGRGTEGATDAPYFLALAGLPGGIPVAASAPVLPSSQFHPELVPSITSVPAVDTHGARGGDRIFDPRAIKLDFPILTERVHGRPLVWLDNAATTQ